MSTSETPELKSKSGTGATVAWALGLAACLCNLIIVLLPIGLLLGIAALVLGVVSLDRERSPARSDDNGASRTRRGIPGLALSGLSFLIAAIWFGTIVAVFLVDPTLL